jgi:hypothetical protein
MEKNQCVGADCSLKEVNKMNYVGLFGLLTFLSMITTIVLGAMNKSVKWHKVVAGLTLLFALVHLGFIYLR